jgi:hypothetical protein
MRFLRSAITASMSSTVMSSAQTFLSARRLRKPTVLFGTLRRRLITFGGGGCFEQYRPDVRQRHPGHSHSDRLGSCFTRPAPCVVDPLVP